MICSVFQVQHLENKNHCIAIILPARMPMQFQDIASSNLEQTNIPQCQYQDAVEIWIRKPHTVNRRLIGAKFPLELNLSLQYSDLQVQDMISKEISQLKGDVTMDDLRKMIEMILKVNDANYCQDDLDRTSENEDDTHCNVHKILIRDLVPKQLERFHTSREIILKCK